MVPLLLILILYLEKAASSGEANFGAVAPFCQKYVLAPHSLLGFHSKKTFCPSKDQRGFSGCQPMKSFPFMISSNLRDWLYPIKAVKSNKKAHFFLIICFIF